jgi:hypothetical protein
MKYLILKKEFLNQEHLHLHRLILDKLSHKLLLQQHMLLMETLNNILMQHLKILYNLHRRHLRQNEFHLLRHQLQLNNQLDMSLVHYLHKSHRKFLVL